MSEIVIKIGTEAYYVDVTSITNVLTSGGYTLDNGEGVDVLQKITGFDHTEHTLSVVTDADEMKALKLLEGGGYALWKVYTGTPKIHAGYLCIKDGDGYVVKLDGNAITDDDTDGAVASALIIAYIAEHQTEVAADFPDAADAADAITTAKSKIKIAVEE